MVLIVLERVPPGLRGEITRWMLELRAGVFLGNLSAMVRDRLWLRACESMGEGAGVLVYSTDNEQGFAIDYYGERTREPVDFEGLFLVRLKRQQKKGAAEG